MLIFNYVGLVMAAIAFGVAFAVGAVIGTEAEGPLMIIAGPFLVAMDLAYRFKAEEKSLWSTHRGGSLFLLPAWVMGAVWLVLGIVYTMQGNA